jgi:hypothetical protein
MQISASGLVLSSIDLNFFAIKHSNPAGDMLPINSNRLVLLLLLLLLSTTTSRKSTNCFERTAAPIAVGGARSP